MSISRAKGLIASLTDCKTSGDPACDAMLAERLGRRLSVSGVLLRKIVKSQAVYCFLVLPECILATRLCFLQSRNYPCPIPLQKFSKHSLLWASLLRYSVHEVSSLERKASNFSSVITLLFLSRFLSISEAVVLRLSTKLIYSWVVVLEIGTEIFCNIFYQTYIWNKAGWKTEAV